ncbi:MAG: hypothetical protein JNK56_10730 [Myxococcales bacterium]|nr:hypothetical protein [Myxococcales bacterium]
MASERPLARRGVPHHLAFALTIPADQVVPRLLERPDVRLRDEGAALPAEPSYELEPAAHGFTLTSEPGGPGAWRPGTRAICEATLTPIPGGAQLDVQFRLHPLTRGAFLFLALMGLAMVGFQLAVAGPVTAMLLLLPILVIATLLAADRTRLRRQQHALRGLIESTFTPLAQARLAASADPFRLGAGPAPRR